MNLSLTDLQEKTDTRSTELYRLGPETPLSYFGMAMMGEGGEFCNLLAKLERLKMGAADGGNSIKVEDITMEKLAEEIGGMLIFAAILTKRMGINLEEAVIKTFNAKSIKMGYPVLLGKEIADLPHCAKDPNLCEVSFCDWPHCFHSIDYQTTSKL